MTDNRPAFVSGLVGRYPARLTLEGECPGRRRSDPSAGPRPTGNDAVLVRPLDEPPL